MITHTTICDHGERENECPSCRPTDPDLGELLDAVERTLRRYIVMRDDAFTVVTIWVAHVFAFAAAEFTPYLAVTSATKRSGKSRLLEVLEVILGPTRAISTSNISSASLFRLIDANPGMAVLVDEIDRMLKERAEELWGLINSGWRITGKAHRQTGPKMTELAAFSTFSPKVLAGIGQPLPDTVADRSFSIRMERRLPSERVERLRLRKAVAEIAPIREALTKWANPATIERLSNAEPMFPPSITNDRLMDVSEPLLAIADLAGGDWPHRVRRAVVALGDAAEQIAEDELSILSLRHVYRYAREKQVDRMPSVDLLTYMVKLDDGPWAEYWGDKVDAGKYVAPARRLRKLLERFDGVTPKELRIGARNVRGYELGPIQAAIDRYLPDPPATSATTATPLASEVAGVAGVAAIGGDDGAAPSLTSKLWSVTEVWGGWTWEPVAGWDAIGFHVPFNQHGGLHSTDWAAEEAARRCMGANP